MKQLTCKEKINILNQALIKVLKTHSCGNYLRLNGVDVPWGINNRPYCHKIWIDVYKRPFEYDKRIEIKYNYDITFNENLCNLYEKAQDYIYNKYEFIGGNKYE